MAKKGQESSSSRMLVVSVVVFLFQPQDDFQRDWCFTTTLLHDHGALEIYAVKSKASGSPMVVYIHAYSLVYVPPFPLRVHKHTDCRLSKQLYINPCKLSSVLAEMLLTWDSGALLFCVILASLNAASESQTTCEVTHYWTFPGFCNPCPPRRFCDGTQVTKDYFMFKKNGQLQLSSDSFMDIVIVGGGGGGGNFINAHGGAGGGAGGVIHAVHCSILAGTYDILIGGGGQGAFLNSAANPGQPTSAFGGVALGGGKASHFDRVQPSDSDGGNGGGGEATSQMTGSTKDPGNGIQNDKTPLSFCAGGRKKFFDGNSGGLGTTSSGGVVDQSQTGRVVQLLVKLIQMGAME